MSLAEMSAAAPPCHRCACPVQRVELSWYRDDEGWWRSRAYLVCGAGCRVPVEPLSAG